MATNQIRVLHSCRIPIRRQVIVRFVDKAFCFAFPFTPSPAIDRARPEPVEGAGHRNRGLVHDVRETMGFWFC
jgi:hypothetical protein